MSVRTIALDMLLTLMWAPLGAAFYSFVWASGYGHVFPVSNFFVMGAIFGLSREFPAVHDAVWSVGESANALALDGLRLFLCWVAGAVGFHVMMWVV